MRGRWSRRCLRRIGWRLSKAAFGTSMRFQTQLRIVADNTASQALPCSPDNLDLIWMEPYQHVSLLDPLFACRIKRDPVYIESCLRKPESCELLLLDLASTRSAIGLVSGLLKYKPDLLVGHRQIALPAGVAGIGPGEPLGDGEAVLVGLQRLRQVALRHQHVA